MEPLRNSCDSKLLKGQQEDHNVNYRGIDRRKREESIDVNAPASKVYNQWTQFEEFPRFMVGVLEVRQLDDKRLHWRTNIGGKEKDFIAEITESAMESQDYLTARANGRPEPWV